MVAVPKKVKYEPETVFINSAEDTLDWEIIA